MNGLVKEMLLQRNWAVSGSTHNVEKYAHKIYIVLKEKGYNIFSLNPSGKSVNGDASYDTLVDIPVKPDVINMVINPVKGKKIIEDAISLGIKYIWFQPGAETDELIKMAEEAGIEVVYNRCVLIELG